MSKDSDSDDLGPDKFFGCSGLPENDISCCGTCYDDENAGYSDMPEKKDKNGNVWTICCKHLDTFDEMEK